MIFLMLSLSKYAEKLPAQAFREAFIRGGYKWG